MKESTLEKYLNAHLSAKEIAANLSAPKDLIISSKDICFRIIPSNKCFGEYKALSEWKHASLTAIVNPKDLPKEFQTKDCRGVAQDDGATVHIFRDGIYVTSVYRARCEILIDNAKDYLKDKKAPIKIPVYTSDGNITYKPQMEKN